MYHNSQFYNQADQMQSFNDNFQAYDEQVGVESEWYPSYEHEKMRCLQHHNSYWDNQFQQNCSNEEQDSNFHNYHHIPENNYYIEHQYYSNDFQLNNENNQMLNFNENFQSFGEQVDVEPEYYPMYKHEAIKWLEDQNSSWDSQHQQNQLYFRNNCESESCTEQTSLQNMQPEYMIEENQRRNQFEEMMMSMINQINESSHNMQNHLEEINKALNSREFNSSSSKDLQNSYTDEICDDSISLIDDAVQERPHDGELEHNETFQSNIIEEYGEIEEKETIPTCVVEVSKEEIQKEAVPDFIIKSNTPFLAFDVQQQDEGYVLKDIVLEQSSNQEGSYFIKVALGDDTEVRKRVSIGIYREIIQAKEHLKIFILVKARAFNRAGVG